ncbi:transposase (fragment) [Xenorhabdus szentirmaii DSM 16338]|uniref:Transposase n=1 Tax=Xenorhabdus szentirmaii DSM 16338 TaxID=1427518 RepID=W1ITF0_9GAMM
MYVVTVFIAVFSFFKHYRIKHNTEYADPKNCRNPNNGFDKFWNQPKRYLRKFNGIPKVHFD